MYTLLSGLYRALTQKGEFSVLILGLDNAGKTTFLESAKTKFTKGYRGVNPSKITATVGLNIGNIEADGVVLNFWDLGKFTLSSGCQNNRKMSNRQILVFFYYEIQKNTHFELSTYVHNVFIRSHIQPKLF